MTNDEVELVLSVFVENPDTIRLVEAVLNLGTYQFTAIKLTHKVNEEVINLLSVAFNILFLTWREFQKMGLCKLLQKSQSKAIRRKTRKGHQFLMGFSLDPEWDGFALPLGD